jgi:hypothetical protein
MNLSHGDDLASAWPAVGLQGVLSILMFLAFMYNGLLFNVLHSYLHTWNSDLSRVLSYSTNILFP